MMAYRNRGRAMGRLLYACTMLLVVSGQTAKVPITTGSPEARALYLQGRALNEQLRAHDANAMFERAAANDPTFAMAEYSLALTALTAKARQDHLDKAARLAEKASEGERLLIRAQQARANADPAGTMAHVLALVARYPQDERAHWALGNSYLGRQHYDQAIAEYQKAIAINPGYSAAYNSVGYAYRPTGNLAAAEKAFQKYIALVPNDPNPYDSYAELLMKMGRWEASIAEYRKALAIDPHFGASHVGIAADQMFAGRHAEAIAEAQIYYDAARDDGERRIARFSQTTTYLDEGSTDKALQLTEQQYAASRTIADTASMGADAVAIADILLDLGRVDAARDRYQQAHDLVAMSGLSADTRQNNDLAWHANMARVALAEHRVAMARTEVAAFLRGAETRHNDARMRQAHGLNGLVALEEKQFDRSLAELAQADQQDPTVRYAMAAAWRGKGDPAKADELAAQAVTMYILPTLPYVLIRAKARPLASR